MNKKKQAITITLLFVAVLVLVAMNSTLFSAKVDITENQVFTIQESSKKIMQLLPEELRITYFLTEKLKSTNTIYRQIEDVLKQYAAASDGKVVLKILDPGKDPDAEKLARQNGIQISEQSSRESRDSANVFLAASGLIIEYQDKKIPIAQISSIESLEYDLTAFIQSIVRNKTKTVGYIIKKDNWDNSTFESILRSAFEPAFRSELLTPGEPIPDSIDALLVVGSPDFTESELYEIDQYIMRGGKALFAIDAVRLIWQPQIQQAMPYQYKPLLDMLQSYGAKILPGYVLEDQNFVAPIYGQRGNAAMYEYFFFATKQNAAKDNIITANFTPLTFEWTSPIELVPPLGVEAVALNSSSENSVKVLDRIEINPQTVNGLRNSMKDKSGKSILVASLKGSFPSYFQGKEVPQSKEDTAKNILYTSIPSRLIVIGTSNFIDPGFIQMMGMRGGEYYWNNFSYFTTCMQWLTDSEELITIKTRSNRDTTLSKLRDDEDTFNSWAGFATYLNLIFIPLCVVLFGIIKYLLRRKAKTEK